MMQGTAARNAGRMEAVVVCAPADGVQPALLVTVGSGAHQVRSRAKKTLVLTQPFESDLGGTRLGPMLPAGAAGKQTRCGGAGALPARCCHCC